MNLPLPIVLLDSCNTNFDVICLYETWLADNKLVTILMGMIIIIIIANGTFLMEFQ